MAKVLDLPAVPPFSVSGHRTHAQRWEKWTKSLDYYLRASGVTDQKQKRSVLLHLAGPDAQEIFETLPNTGDDYKTALNKLNEYFQPKRNLIAMFFGKLPNSPTNQWMYLSLDYVL